jgi:hypothetical protein
MNERDEHEIHSHRWNSSHFPVEIWTEFDVRVYFLCKITSSLSDLLTTIDFNIIKIKDYTGLAETRIAPPPPRYFK